MKNALALLLAFVLAFGNSLNEPTGMGRHGARCDVRQMHKHIASSVVGLGIALSSAGSGIWPQNSMADSMPSLSESSAIASTSSASLTNPAWHKAEFNKPSDDFWYPPFIIGDWNADFKFEEAVFSDKVPIDDMAKVGMEIPGLSKYSILPVPNVGEDASNVKLRFVQLDSHPREDHSYNLRHLMEKFSSKPSVKVDSAPYNYQKAPDWFHSPANRREIVFHEEGSSGLENKPMKAELYTQKRDINTFAGSVETVEFVRQTLEVPGQAPKVSDYALDWQFSVPASLRDEFITVDDLRKSDTILGRLHVFVYVSPSSDLYSSLSGQPVGVYKYQVNMNRVDASSKDRGTKSSVYPFVWRDVGPVELRDYFGY